MGSEMCIRDRLIHTYARIKVVGTAIDVISSDIYFIGIDELIDHVGPTTQSEHECELNHISFVL